MAASVKPEAGKEEAPKSPSPSTPPTNPPTDPPTEGKSVEPGKAEGGVPDEVVRLRRLVEAQEAALRDQNRKIAEHTQRMREFEKSAAPKPPSEAEMNEEFWRNPTGVMNRLIKQELAATVVPLNERIQQEASLTAYERAKLQLKARYSDIWDKIEPTIDQFIEGARSQGVEINDQVLNIGALTATGMYYRGEIEGAAPPKPQAREENKVVTPPHLRPSAPTIPGTAPEKKEVRDLTENERRLARERNMTPEQYLEWLEVPPEDVVKAKIGRES